MPQATHDFAAARREAVVAMPEYFNLLQSLGMPQLNLAMNQASLQGAGIGQDVASALGALGGTSTGAGALTRSMAQGASYGLQSQLRLNFMQGIMSNALNMLATNLQAGMNGKGASVWESMLANLPGAGGAALGGYFQKPSTPKGPGG